MGIRPPSDLVFDVMQAADASRARAVVGKLQSLSPGDGAAFARALDATEEGAAPAAAASAARAAALIPPGLGFSGTTLTHLRNAHALSERGATGFAAATPGSATLKKFEAMAVSRFLDQMMPASSSIYGSSQAGQTWKSLLTEKLGEHIADAGGIGIARRLEQAARAHGPLLEKTGATA